MELRQKQQIQELLGTKESKGPVKYLSVKIDGKRIPPFLSANIVENEKLAGWKLVMIYFAGGITLLRAVLSAIPTFAFENGWVPNSVVNEIEKIMRTFLWVKEKEEIGCI